MHKEKPATRSIVGTIITLLLAAAISVCVAAAVACVALWAMPNSWYGASFGAASQYPTLVVTIFVAILLSIVLFVGFAAVYFGRRKGKAGAIMLSERELADAPRLLKWWRALFVLMLLTQALPWLPASMADDSAPLLNTVLWWLGMLLLLVNAVMVHQVAGLFGRQPVVMALASILLGPLGAVGVFIFLHLSGAAKTQTSA